MNFLNASYLVWERQSKHVQNEAEKALRRCNDPEGRYYIRACAGFTGFAKQDSPINKIREFSAEVEERVGREKWREWGSEQVASNYLFANSPGSVILPYEQYPFYEPGIDESNVKLMHFIGTHRFKKGRYAALALDVIDSL